MSGGGGSSPKPDKNIGRAALRTAEVGEDHLDWMQKQAKVTNGWAAEDRARSKDVFQPLQDDYIREADTYDTEARRDAEASAAAADVQSQIAGQRAASDRQMSAMGVDPRSGRYAETRGRGDTAAGLAAAGAGNMARRRVEDTGRSMRAAAVNMGSGFQVNPATSIGLSNGAASSGAQAAQSGNRAMGSMLNQQYQNEVQRHQAEQQSAGGLMGSIGQLGGMALSMSSKPWILSSKDAKTEKRAAPGILDALEKMPVERWKYKDGMGDGGGVDHVGPYAEDFQKATGLGDGKTIGLGDAMGVTLGAVQELSAKVDKLAGERAA